MDESSRIDILNDLFFPDGTGPSKVIDARGFFPRTQISVISHNAGKIFSDMEKGQAEPITLTKKQILRVAKVIRTNSGDLFDPKNLSLNFRSFLSKNRIIRPNPIIIITPLGELRHNTIDTRHPQEIFASRLYPDIYVLPLPLLKRLTRAIKKIRKSLRKNWRRIGITSAITLTFIASVAILGVSAKNYVEHATIIQYTRLQSLKHFTSLTDFQKEVQDIKQSFEIISAVFFPFQIALDNRIYSNKDVHLAHNVIAWGMSLSEALSDLTDLSASALSNLPKNTQGWVPLDLSAIQKSNLKITDFLRTNKSSIVSIKNHLGEAISNYARVESLGNKTFDETLQKNLSALIGIKESIDFILDNFEPIMSMLGDTKPQKYLILNQNRDELRANGGFPGSALYIELYKWRIEKFEKRDIYDYDWKLYPYKEKPPEGLANFTSNFGLRDANYYPDFRESAEKINFFFEKAWGASLDTVAVINQGIILDLLRKYGPVKIPSLNLTLDADNFSRTMSTLVEAQFVPYKKLDTGNTFQSPKEVLFRFMESLGKHLMDERDFIGYLSIIRENMKHHEILIASRNEATNDFLKSLGTTDVSWKGNTNNWIYPLFTSLSGNKSDRYMKRTFELKSEVFSGCTILNHVRLISDHTITIDEQLKTRKILYDFGILDVKAQERLLFIEWNGRNRQYIRFILPPGSKLRASSAQTATQEDDTPDYSNISLLMETAPMQSSTVGFDYTSIPANCQAKLEFHKQPGLVNYEVK